VAELQFSSIQPSFLHFCTFAPHLKLRSMQSKTLTHPKLRILDYRNKRQSRFVLTLLSNLHSRLGFRRWKCIFSSVAKMIAMHYILQVVWGRFSLFYPEDAEDRVRMHERLMCPANMSFQHYLHVLLDVNW